MLEASCGAWPWTSSPSPARRRLAYLDIRGAYLDIRGAYLDIRRAYLDILSLSSIFSGFLTCSQYLRNIENMEDIPRIWKKY